MIEALIVAIIVIAIVFAIAHLAVRFALIPAGAASFAWLVYLVAALIAILVLWRVIAPFVGGLP